jgi:hypothetical protein
VNVRLSVAIMLAALCVSVSPRAQTPRDLHAPLDRILDTYVRDGYVYYLALKSERAALDRYVQSLDLPAAQVSAWTKNAQLAFWINAYNALVLQTVIDKYPIKAITDTYPAKSIRQIPGSFEQLPHRVAGRTLTLDAIEKTMIVPLGDARALIALGRGAVGSGRVRSEAYRAERLNEQLEQAVQEFVVRLACFKVDRDQNLVTVSPLFGWRQDAFIASFAKAGERWVNRSAIEQALLGMAAPKLFQSERDFLRQNTFQLKYGDFDWRLNDLTGGIPN